MDKKEIEVLRGLGLASTRARVYLALCHQGISDAKAISDITGIARQDIYRITSDLMNMGLVEKVISQPISFRAIPIEEGVSFLLGQRQKALSTLESKTKSLVENFTSNNKKQEERLLSQFVFVPSQEALIYRLKNAIENTETSIDVSTSWKRFKFACYRLAEELEKAWFRKVNGRAIVDATEEADLDILKSYWKSPYAKIRFVKSPPKTVMAIYDKKEVFIYMEPTANFTASPALWSNNPSVVAMAGDCFENLWNTAMEPSEYNLDNIKS
jgi:sugar-specific transcriptional regulator TrmB